MIKPVEIYADTRGSSPCRGPNCRAMLTWAVVVRTGSRMCFTGDPVALKTRLEPSTNRLIETVDLNENHWGVCPDAPSFRRK